MKPNELVILGGGESGVGTAILAHQKGIKVFLSDQGTLTEDYRRELVDHSIDFEENGHTPSRVMSAAELVKSPGIPRSSPLIQQALAASIPVIGELEFAFRYTNAKIIAITGSNGKTTTTLLIHHLLHQAGLDVGLGGNIGTSFARQVAAGDRSYFVLEVSSFQLEDIDTFRADIAILVNITPDHLDRYEYSLNQYGKVKWRITRNQTAKDSFIYCLDDPQTMIHLADQPPMARSYAFTQAPITGPMPAGYITGNDLYIHPTQTSFTMSIFDLSLHGKHNVYNTLAAGICAKILDISDQRIRESMSSFKNIAHRLESVARVQGIEFINDSKATNVNAVWYALETMNTPVIWIAGGIDKGNDYSMLTPLIRQKVKAIVCLGRENKKLYEAFEQEVEVIVNAFSAQEAVSLAYHLGKKGDTVLLSPACASFDLFKNYEDRGNQFKKAVNEL